MNIQMDLNYKMVNDKKRKNKINRMNRRKVIRRLKTSSKIREENIALLI